MGEAKSVSAGLATVVWTVVGGLLGLGVVSLLTVGVYMLVAGVALGALAAWWRIGRPSDIVLGGAIGVGVVAFYLAWLNSGGPGDVCHTNAMGQQSCIQEWSPWPFVIVGVVVILGGIATGRWMQHQQPGR